MLAFFGSRLRTPGVSRDSAIGSCHRPGGSERLRRGGDDGRVRPRRRCRGKLADGGRDDWQPPRAASLKGVLTSERHDAGVPGALPEVQLARGTRPARRYSLDERAPPRRSRRRLGGIPLRVGWRCRFGIGNHRPRPVRRGRRLALRRAGITRRALLHCMGPVFRLGRAGRADNGARVALACSRLGGDRLHRRLETTHTGLGRRGSRRPSASAHPRCARVFTEQPLLAGRSDDAGLPPLLIRQSRIVAAARALRRVSPNGAPPPDRNGSCALSEHSFV
jgi:hypothetical protein